MADGLKACRRVDRLGGSDDDADEARILMWWKSGFVMRHLRNTLTRELWLASNGEWLRELSEWEASLDQEGGYLLPCCPMRKLQSSDFGSSDHRASWGRFD